MEKFSTAEKIKLFTGVGNWNTYSANNKLPVLTMTDGPHGLRKQDLEHYAAINDSKIATCFPTASCVACSWDEKILRLMGKSIGLEAVHENVNLLLGPGMNIKRSPLCGRNFEYFAEDPYLSGKMAASYVKGVQETGAGSCIKHFACNNQEKRRQSSSSNIDQRTLHEIYLRGFEIAVKEAKPASIMCSYNRINGVYASQNKELLTDTLRTKWNYEGFVVSDWGACIGAAKSLKAGLDLAMPDSHGYIEGQLEKALASGELTEEDLDKANSRLISAIKKLDLSDKSKEMDYSAQYKNAVLVAENSAVLLKNDGALPISPSSTPLYVFGDMAKNVRFQGGGSSHVNTNPHENLVERLEAAGFSVKYSPAYAGAADIEEVRQLAQQSQKENAAIIFVYGLDDFSEGEGFDRQNLEVPDLMKKAFDTVSSINNNIILVSVSGSPYTLPDNDSTKAILQMYLAGEGFSEACANLLTGKANPSGKLAETWLNQNQFKAILPDFGKDSMQIDYKERGFYGYRYFSKPDCQEKPRYAFGHGLSYTTFQYSDFEIISSSGSDDDLLQVQFKLKNDGPLPGSEISQVYVAYESKDVPLQAFDLIHANQLRGFAKTTLQPGETATVTIQLDSNAFTIYNAEKGCFDKVKGIFNISLGRSSQDFVFTKSVEVKNGTNLSDFSDSVLNPPIPHVDFDTAKRKFTISDTMLDMSKKSVGVRIALHFIRKAIYSMNKGKSKDDPSVKIAISGLEENPLESVISTSNGMLNGKIARRIVKLANLF